MKCPGGWIPVRYPPITTKKGRKLPGNILAAFHPHLESRMGPSAFQMLLQDLGATSPHWLKIGPTNATQHPLETT